MMGATLSKFSRMNQIRSFPGEVFSDNQYVEEIEDFSEESDTCTVTITIMIAFSRSRMIPNK